MLRPQTYIWSPLYKADIIKASDVRFENFRLGADSLFNFKLLPLMKRVAFVSDALYNYVRLQISQPSPLASLEPFRQFGNYGRIAGLGDNI